MGYDTLTQDVDTLIQEKMHLVNKVIRQMNIKDSVVLDKDDYYTTGLMGLYDAIKKYDTSKNKKFDDYAKLRIRGAIIDEMRRVGEISRNNMTKLNEYYDVVNDLRERNMEEPSDDLVMSKLEISPSELNNIYNIMSFLSKDSLDEVVFNNTPLINVVKNQNTLTPEQELIKKEKYEILSSHISTLDERLQLILDFIYVRELSLKEISAILDISVSRVSQLHGKALMKIKSFYVNE